jgi:hypothetical protein
LNIGTSEKRQAGQSIEQKVTKETKKTGIKRAVALAKPLFPFVLFVSFCSKRVFQRFLYTGWFLDVFSEVG